MFLFIFLFSLKVCLWFYLKMFFARVTTGFFFLIVQLYNWAKACVAAKLASFIKRIWLIHTVIAHVSAYGRLTHIMKYRKPVKAVVCKDSVRACDEDEKGANFLYPRFILGIILVIYCTSTFFLICRSSACFFSKQLLVSIIFCTAGKNSQQTFETWLVQWMIV